MKNMRKLYFLMVMLFTTISIFAQTTGFSGTGANIDVDNYQIWWRINPDSTTTAARGIRGVVTIKFKTTVANVSSITLDLASSLAISNVKFRGATVVASRAGNTFTVPFGTTIAAIGTRDSITVTYAGVPPPPSPRGGGLGFVQTTDPAITAAALGALPAYRQTTGSGNNIYTLAESYEDRDWWPCKADMQDKADTIDITVNVPWQKVSLADTFWVATNGTLVDSTIDVVGKSRSFTFQNRYPIASYLVSVCVAKFNRYYRTPINVGGKNLPVVYYLFPGKTAAGYTSILTAMDKVTELVTAFGAKFGDYGFADKVKGGKHGFYEGLGTFGGMEHQTFSAIATNSLTNRSLLAHELAHQWFGDKVTFGKWNDLWLAEGFAKYLEALAPELVTGMGYTAYDERLSIKNTALGQTAPVYIPNSGITNSDNIWSGTTAATQYGGSIYSRGAMVVSMLRTLAGDTKFFNIMRDYQNSPNLAYKSATTDTLKKRFEDTLGINLTEFFNDNVIGVGYPNYTVNYRFAPNKLSLAVATQARRLGTTSPFTPNAATATYFNNPIVVHVKGALAANDTTIVMYDWGGGNLSRAGNGVSAQVPGNLLVYNLSFTPTSIFYDDSARTMSSGSMVLNSTLDLRILDFTVKQHTTYNDATLSLDDNSINTEVILERSADGVVFQDAGIMVLQAGTTISKKYLFNDVKPLLGDNYYRAKYKNIEGIYLYSKIIKVGGTKNIGFTILENPVKDLVKIRTIDAVGKQIAINIYDATGKIITSKNVKNANAITEISLVGAKPGVYVAKIVSGNEEAQNIKFVIQ
jgi:hypothetical protein